MTTQETTVETETAPMPPPHRCPWWIGYLMASPLRRLLESPERLLGSYVSPDMTVLDVGCAMGFFSLPLAKMVGPQGRVICVDVEPRMIAGLKRRARRSGHEARITAVVCQEADLGLSGYEGQVDFAAAIHVVHELTDVPGSLAQISTTLKPAGRLLLLEPRGHVSEAAFQSELEMAAQTGLQLESRLGIRQSRGALLGKAPVEPTAGDR